MMDPLVPWVWIAFMAVMGVILMVAWHDRVRPSDPPPSSRWAIDFVHRQTGKRPADDALLPGRAIVCLIHQCEALSARIAILEGRQL